MAGKRNVNLVKFERNNIPVFRVYNYQSEILVHFNELAVKTLKVFKGDMLFIDKNSGMLSIAKASQVQRDYGSQDSEDDDVDYYSPSKDGSESREGIDDKDQKEYAKGEKDKHKGSGDKYIGFSISHADGLNNYYKANTKANLKSGIYEIDTKIHKKKGPNGVDIGWLEYKFIEDIPLYKDVKVSKDTSTSLTDDDQSFVVRDYLDYRGDTKYTITIPDTKESRTLFGLKKGKYLIIDGEKGRFAVGKHRDDPDAFFFQYRAYVINEKENVFVITNIHHSCFEKTGVYSIGKGEFSENKQKFFKYSYNIPRSNAFDNVSKLDDPSFSDIANSELEAGTFKYSSEPMVKVINKRIKIKLKQLC